MTEDPSWYVRATPAGMRRFRCENAHNETLIIDVSATSMRLTHESHEWRTFAYDVPRGIDYINLAGRARKLADVLGSEERLNRAKAYGFPFPIRLTRAEYLFLAAAFETGNELARQ